MDHAPTVVLVTDPRSRRHAYAEGTALAAAGELRRVEWHDAMAEAERFACFDAALPGADAVVVGPWTIAGLPPFTAERWALAPELKVIAGTFDNRFGHWLDVADALHRGVTVIDTSRSMTPTVAEFALAMTLNALRDIPASIQLVRDGAWKTDHWDQPGFVFGDLTGRRVGLAGYGSINRRYAELLVPFRCAVMARDPFVADADLAQAGIRRVATLPALAAESEIFVVGIPPTPATQGIISREVIDALPRGAIFILVTRMAVVAQEALWRRTEAGEIRAAIDVFAPEPPPADATFRANPFVLPTPHIAGDTTVCHRRCFTTACDDALAVLAGRTPTYAVTVHDDQLYQGTLDQTAG
ncbi:MAG: NAD(P)-dependent oxidoreductase [Thermomicrobiales bacterium]